MLTLASINSEFITGCQATMGQTSKVELHLIFHWSDLSNSVSEW